MKWGTGSILAVLLSSVAIAPTEAAGVAQNVKSRARSAFCQILSKTQSRHLAPVPCEKVLNAGPISNDALSLLESQEVAKAQDGCVANIPSPEHMQDWFILNASEQYDTYAKKALSEYCPRLSRIGSPKELVSSCAMFLQSLRRPQQAEHARSSGDGKGGDGKSGNEKEVLLDQLSKSRPAQVLLAALLRQSVMDRAQESCLTRILAPEAKRVGQMKTGASDSRSQHDHFRKNISEHGDPSPVRSGFSAADAVKY